MDTLCCNHCTSNLIRLIEQLYNYSSSAAASFMVDVAIRSEMR